MPIRPIGFGGVRIMTSPHCTALPDRKPHTDDMRAYVDEMARRGEIRRVPTAYQTKEGIVCHPVIYARLMADRRRMARDAGKRRRR